jgi:glycosyltransferase involved in cell wall biosynthesis
VKLAVVVQRYGADINGGAELHARYIAEHLTRHADVQVLTTCARDYLTWKNELPPGDETLNGVRVRRFSVSRPRDTADFGRRSQLVFERTHSVADELAWLDSQGPRSPELIRHVERSRDDVDFFIFFSYRYYHSWHGARAVPDKAVLVPTAERDAAAGVSLFAPVFRSVRSLMFNSLEERKLLESVAGQQLPGVVVGVGSEIPERTQPWRLKKKLGIKRPYAIYIGRIDENKGCKELFAFFERYAAMYPNGVDLLLVGTAILPIPKHPRIRHAGFLSDEDKFDALAGAD